ncbi:hypothetical protein Y032_0044g936 [Ancylostoma ceylanicum]|nr:hypothetical protein Y032_0044g936 [Ancylostoma ceylanicum]
MSQGGGEHHAGPSELEDICQTIVRSEGPSGSNIEYALLLADTLHKQAPHAPDSHVFEVERRVLELCNSTGAWKDVLAKMGYSQISCSTTLVNAFSPISRQRRKDE